MANERGILWLSFDSQQSPVDPIYPQVARHFHVTLHFNCRREECDQFIGRSVQVDLISNCFNEGIQACSVRINDERIAAICRNEHPHVTISMAPGFTPRMSNDMLVHSYTSELIGVPAWATVEFSPFPS